MRQLQQGIVLGGMGSRYHFAWQQFNRTEVSQWVICRHFGESKRMSVLPSKSGHQKRRVSLVVRAVDEQAAHAHVAHVGEGDLGRAGRAITVPII